MKGARVAERRVVIQEVAEPVAEVDHAVVRVVSAGVCHSDLHIARGDWGFPASGGLGHEAIGVVESVGAGAERYVQQGDRVIFGLGGMGGAYWCGSCEQCLGGEPQFCPQGRALLGTFAERIAVWAPALTSLPASVSDVEAPLACGGLTAYGAIKKLFRFGIDPGSRIAIIGAAGGLGHYAVQLAAAFGYRVLAVDIGADRLEFAGSLGADVVVDATDDALADHGGVAASLVFSASLSGFRTGLALLRRGGLLLGVGIPPTSDGMLELSPFELFSRNLTISYSAVGTVQDMRELVQLAADGKVHTHVGRTGPLSDLEQIFEELQAGQYVGRAVITDVTR
jgi:propanol-preferring alcohol dehydrogenase